MDPEECIKLDKCHKIDMVLDKDILGFQCADAIREICGSCKEGQTKDNEQEPRKYVYLSPTVLFPVPDCFSISRPDFTSEKCWLCPVKRQCDARMETVLR